MASAADLIKGELIQQRRELDKADEAIARAGQTLAHAGETRTRLLKSIGELEIALLRVAGEKA